MGTIALETETLIYAWTLMTNLEYQTKFGLDMTFDILPHKYGCIADIISSVFNYPPSLHHVQALPF